MTQFFIPHSAFPIMHRIAQAIRALNGLIITTGAYATVETSGPRTSIIRVRLTARSADTFQSRIDNRDLAKLQPLCEHQPTLPL